MVEKLKKNKSVLTNEVHLNILLLKSYLGVDKVIAMWFVDVEADHDGFDSLINVVVFVLKKVEVRLLVDVINIEVNVVKLVDARSN